MSISDRSPQFATLPSQIAAVVPEGKKDDGKWNSQELFNSGVSPVSYEREVDVLIREGLAQDG